MEIETGVTYGMGMAKAGPLLSGSKDAEDGRLRKYMERVRTRSELEHAVKSMQSEKEVEKLLDYNSRGEEDENMPKDKPSASLVDESVFDSSGDEREKNKGDVQCGGKGSAFSPASGKSTKLLAPGKNIGTRIVNLGPDYKTVRMARSCASTRDSSISLPRALNRSASHPSLRRMSASCTVHWTATCRLGQT